MDTFAILSLCFKRWYVCLPIIAAAIAAGVVSAQDEKPMYEARVAIGILGSGSTPADPPEGQARPYNPYGVSSSGAKLLINALASDLKTDAVLARIGVRAGESTLDVVTAPNNPVFDIVVTSDDSDRAAGLLSNAVSVTQALSRQTQIDARAPENQLLQTRALGQAPPPTRAASKALTRLFVILLLGLAAAIACAVAVDTLAEQWRRRRARRRERALARRTAAAELGPEGPREHVPDDAAELDLDAPVRSAVGTTGPAGLGSTRPSGT